MVYRGGGGDTTVTVPRCATRCCEGDRSDWFDRSGCRTPAAAPSVSPVPRAAAWELGLHRELRYSVVLSLYTVKPLSSGVFTELQQL